MATMSVAALAVLASLARQLQAGEAGCRSTSLLQTKAHEAREQHKFSDATFTHLFPGHRGIDLDATSSLAVSLVLQRNQSLNQSLIWKMLNPSLYPTEDGSWRVLGRVTHSTRCACPADSKKWCMPKEGDGDDYLVSCSMDTGDGCSVIGPYQDPHAFIYGGQRLAFVDKAGQGVCIPMLLNLTSLQANRLVVPGMGWCEKNWMPFEHEGSLYFSHWLQPAHAVIRCDVGSHTCETVFNTSTTLSFDGLPSFAPRGGESVHGSSPWAELDSDHLVASAHYMMDPFFWQDKMNITFRSKARLYWHTFVAIERKPPFAIVANSPWFQLPVPDAGRDAEWSEIQYMGGMMRQGEDLVLSYGVGDCLSHAMRVPVSEVAHALGL
eukprot:TRINITY_DN860_c0_g1_i2.p1 TRINITY_DN860_c0_g1~~TRINITY_DN860_c0_g1_i2.p1  ORF type:complete len:380 (+),score=32.04 TRINITY_DN860_c0_g1_i2:79-1218(+)